jgi:hypothetical protein
MMVMELLTPYAKVTLPLLAVMVYYTDITHLFV